MIKEALIKVVDKIDLTEDEAIKVMNEIMSGEALPSQIAAFITALRMKKETVTEITGFVKVMREKVTKVLVKDKLVVDTCGTGGDGAFTFNISTTAAFVAAGAGVTIAKHGNRAVSSACGSADVLKQLGVNIDASLEKVEQCIEEIGIGFLFAPLLHKAMKYAIGPRREIGIRTIFNILGPLTNPANASYQVLGVYDSQLTEILANVLLNLGTKHTLVVAGKDGLDEITTTTETKISEIKLGKIMTYYLNPKVFGIKKANLFQLKGGTLEENADITREILKGVKGPQRDIVVLNAAAAILVSGKAKNFTEGIKMAEKSIDSSSAEKKLNLLMEYSHN